ncbi:hypothetical protein FB565_004843 [Actinoplanes lutulentus]|uniref:Ig-like protein group 3 n=1 Tax=Actinoplanes lutulentus TaxID=1287878 RepID=A0A327Z5N1_9ACTN|nr:Ig-like domain-containing protein [Actinoplanes lutulentus]MBB2945110.1 hypothetical protein [Actinoplanes lutulentus]RAK31906.1 hypothetical protein B0I29_114156 [Actinoplanes lutulentus]
MKLLRTAVAAALCSSLILTAAGPAVADEIVDTTAPVVTATGVSEGQLLGHFVTLHPTFSDDVGVLRVDVLINGEGQGSAWPDEIATGGLRFSPSTAFNGMDVNLTVRATDHARNVGVLTTRVRIDTALPGAVFTPDDGAKLHGMTSIQFSKVSSDVVQVALIWEDKEVSRANAAPWTLPWDTRKFPGQVSGETRMTIRVTDRAGNFFDYRYDYLVDNAGPEVRTFEFPDVVGPGTTHLYAHGRDLSGTARLEWWVDGVRRATTENYSHDFGGKSRIAAVTIKAWDKLGNASSITRTVTVDATGPTVTWLSPKSGTLVRGRSIPTSIRVADAHPETTALLLNNATGYLDCKPICGSKALFTADGKQSIVWVAYDRFGNGTTVRRTVIVDSQKPSLKVTKAPKNKAKVKGTVKVRASASDKNGVARVELLVNGKVVAVDKKAAYKFSINTKKYGKKIKIQLRAYDKAGNVTKTSIRTWYR